MTVQEYADDAEYSLLGVGCISLRRSGVVGAPADWMEFVLTTSM